MTVPKRLIITADDFGYSPQVNEAVVESHRAGILGFASLLVSGDAAEEAVRRARRECPDLGIGLHLNLCCGRSVLPPGVLAGLVDSGGNFPDDAVRCGLRYFFREELRGALEAEMRGQFERFLGFGLEPGHVDGHLNIHVHPVVFPLLVRLAREYGFHRIRIPSGELRISLGYRVKPLLPQVANAATFALLKAYLLRCHGDPRMEVPERCWGLLRSGLMSEEYLLWLLERLPEGTTEIYFHPSSDPADAPNAHPTPTHHSVLELRALTSPQVKAMLAERGIIPRRAPRAP